jgi:ABC-type bacteriocin/lantibiotic exporter with double-glycine peptidase domain
LHKPNAGRIEVGGRDVTPLPQARLSSQIVLVPQDSRFFTRSISDNLRLAVPEATQVQIAAACRLSAAHEFINAFPQGYETTIGDFSANLSAGEKQRLAIARALLIDPPVLILDEATSNLDPPTEAIVLTNVLRARNGKTTILVSHRPRVVERADWILWIDDGRIRSVGTVADFRRESSACADFLNA